MAKISLYECKDYLNGSSFDPGLKVEIPHTELMYRIELLESLTKGLKVIHLGCTDHLPLIQEKIRKDTWLHARIVRSSERCLGVDINNEAVKYVRRELGYKDVYCADLSSQPLAEIRENSWDLLVMGEIIEHVPSPSSFINKLINNLEGRVKHLIITVPNAFALENTKFTRDNIEFINSDHYFWFTPYTISRILENAGCEIEKIYMCESTRPSQRARVRHYLYYRKIESHSLLRNTIVVLARIKETDSIEVKQ